MDSTSAGPMSAEVGRGGIPTVLVSSRDGAPVPDVKGARSLQRSAEAAGWTVLQTYALAEVSAAYYATRPGVVKRPAYQLATVAVRLARGEERGYAVWASEDGGAWGFLTACLGLWTAPIGLREMIKRLKR